MTKRGGRIPRELINSKMAAAAVAADVGTGVAGRTRPAALFHLPILTPVLIRKREKERETE